MTPERLAEIRAHFKNPPSASCNAQWALELCDALERLMSPLHFVVGVDPAMPETEAVTRSAVGEVRIINLAPPDPIVFDDRPKKKGAKK